MARLFSRAKVVFNCSLAGDLNMRVFEALSCGSFLVTDRAANGLEDFFADGEHLALYDDNTLEQVIAASLEDPGRREEIAARACRLVHRHHSYSSRMDRVLECALSKKKRPARIA
jgi:spore maturation protein CgeB